MFYDELKTVSIAQIEEAIGKAVSGIAGAEFKCSISNIDLTSINGAKLEIFLAPPHEFDAEGDVETLG